MAQVVAHQDELQAAYTDVVTVSFAVPYWCQVWLQETQSPFPFLLDSERTAYGAYGLESSFWRSWSPANLWYYAKAMWRGQQTLGKRGDTQQLGGDFVVDRHGIVRLAHPSRDPTDRPTMTKILTTLQTLS